jgi:hypothetical protein
VTAHYSTDPQVQREAWQQFTKLLSGQPWRFRAEHWPYVKALSEWHHLDIIFYRELSARPGQHQFSNEQIEQLHSRVLDIRKHLLLLTQLQQQIHLHLKSSGIRALFFKGVVTGQWLYGSNLRRQCRDIDLIVHPGEHEEACHLLRQIDFFRLIPAEDTTAFGIARYRAAMKDYSMVHRPSGALVELHWALHTLPQTFQFDFNQAWENRTEVSIEEKTVPTFSDQTHIRYMAAHGCNSHWGRLCWLMDWFQISQLNPDWPTLIDACANPRETAQIKNAFILLNKLLDSPIPAAVDNLPKPRFSNFSTGIPVKSQMNCRYPSWPLRQLLLLACQQDLSGALDYVAHMTKKTMAVDTLQPK